MKELAQQALDCLLEQRPVVITHPAGWKRDNGFPLPIKKEKPSEDGTTTQTYRPVAIFEWIHERLSLEAAAQRAKDRAAEGGTDEDAGALADSAQLAAGDSE